MAPRARRFPRVPNENGQIESSASNRSGECNKDHVRRIRPISKVTHSGAITRVKVPVHTWYYSPTGDELFEHRKGAFYSHSREGSVDGEAAIFRLQTTRKPIPSNNIYPATIESSTSGIAMLSYDKENNNIWREVTDSEELVSLLLERNADHLRQATLDGTPFTTAPLKELFGLYSTAHLRQQIKFSQVHSTFIHSGYRKK
jgi:hypothetical protein